MEITNEVTGAMPGPGFLIPVTLIFLPMHTVEKPLQACRVCLLTDCRLYSMQQCNLKDMFKQLTGLQLLDDKYPSSLCAECATFLVKCKRFREKSLTVQETLNVLSNTSSTVTIERIKEVDRKLKRLTSNISVKKQCPDYYDIVCRSENYDESPTNLIGPQIYSELTRDCKDNFVKIASNSPVRQNPSNNIDTDIYVCENYEEETSINIINGKQIKIEPENDYEKKSAKEEPNVCDHNEEGEKEIPTRVKREKIKTELSEENPPDASYITYTYENYEKNTITTLNDSLLSIELFTDSDENDNDKLKTETNIEQVEVKEINENKPKVKLTKERDGSKPATSTAKKYVKKVYNCEHCKKVLKSKSVYLEHLQLEHHSSQHVCCLCGLSFINKRCVREHKRRKHLRDNPHIPIDGPCCPECSLQFLSEEALQTHLHGTLKDSRISVRHSDSEFGEDLNTERSDSPENGEHLDFKSDGVTKDGVKKVSTKRIKKSVATRKCKSRKVPSDHKRIILKNMIAVKRLTLEEQLELVQKRKEFYQNKPFKCDICFFGTYLKKTLETHMMRHSEEMGELSCNLCHFRFNTRQTYLVHKLRHKYMYSCVECPFTTSLRSIATKHVLEFHEKQKFTCSKCGRVYRTINSYYEHKKRQHPSSQHVCCLCGFSFVSKMGLRRHHSAKHLLESIEIPTPTDGPSCAECSLRFMNEKALQTHMRVSHTTGRGKKMLNSASERRTTIKRKVVCETCGKIIDVYHLNSHLQEHAGKTFSCSICGLTFRTKSRMYQHKFYNHGKGKDYERRKEDLFACKDCDKTYNTKTNLNRHIDRAHSGNIVPCNYCHKQFSCKEHLKKHVDHVHLKKPWYKKRAK